MLKGPALVCLNFHTATARRYIRRKNWAVPGLGWELVKTHEAKIDPQAGFDPAGVEAFRVSGA